MGCHITESDVEVPGEGPGEVFILPKGSTLPHVLENQLYFTELRKTMIGLNKYQGGYHRFEKF
ncbi:MAG: hypothetical protein V3V59_01535 [Thermodesulfovibrionales bacterium]